MFIEFVFGAVGSCLFTTFTPETTGSKWIGYQVSFAIESASFSMVLLIVAQNTLTLNELLIDASMVMFAQMMGSSVFISVMQALFTNKLTSGLQHLKISDVDADNVLTTGVTGITQGSSENVKRAVLRIINYTLTQSWRLPMISSYISIIGALAVGYRKSKPKKRWLIHLESP